MKLSKTTISKTKYFLLALLVAFSFSCSPEDGEDGADGAMGLTGPAGTDGVDGVDGEDGNANVISSGWTEFDTATWTDVASQFGTDYRDYPLTVSEITQEIVDDGMVLVYSRFVVTNTLTFMLPFTENITGADPDGQTISFRIGLNNLNIKMRNASGSGDPGTFGGPGIAEYRYIIVPSNTSGRMQNIDFSTMSYREVIEYFNLDY